VARTDEKAVYGIQPVALRFDQQHRVANDTSKHVALLCGRRAGKTEELCYEAVETLANNQRCHVVFIGLTKSSAREIFFAKLRGLNTVHQWGLKLNEQHMTAIDPVTLSTLMVMGSDTREDLDKIRGLERLARLMLDECGQWRPSLIEYVTDEAGGPALADLNGCTTLSGTPGRILHGHWHNITTGAVKGWSIHRWTIFENPHVPARQFLDELLATKGWNESNPIYRREYLAEWCTDAASLVFSAFSDANIAPCRWDSTYATIEAIDFGVVHNTSFVVMGARSTDPYIRTFSSEQERGLAPTQVADKAKQIKTNYGCSRLIGDLGGMGKAHAQEMQLRHHITIEAAEKREKLTSIELANDRFRTGQAVIDPSNTELIQQLRSVQWNEDHSDIAAGQDDDLLHAYIYGNKAIFHRYIAPVERRDDPPEYVRRPIKTPHWYVGLGAR